MSHSNRKPKNPSKAYVPIPTAHCKVTDVINVLYYNIRTNWMTEEELDEIYKQVKKKLKKDKNA